MYKSFTIESSEGGIAECSLDTHSCFRDYHIGVLGVLLCQPGLSMAEVNSLIEINRT